MNGLTLLRRYTPLRSASNSYVELGDPLHRVGSVFYHGERSPTEPDYSRPVLDLAEFARVQRYIKSAGIEDADPIGTALAGIEDEYYPIAHQTEEALQECKKETGNYKAYRRYIKDAAILKREDFQAFKTISVQAKILTSAPRGHVLTDLITVDNTTDYNTKLYQLDGPFDMVQENLAELSVPRITGFPNLTPLSFGIERNAIHWAMSEEFANEEFDFDFTKIMTDNIAGQMDLVLNKKVADVLNNNATLTAYADWGAKTGNISNRDPGLDIDAEATKIDNTERNEGLVIVSNRKTWNTFLGNYFMNGYGTPTYEPVTYSYGNAIANSVPRFNSLRWGVDSFIGGQKFIAFDPAAIYAAQMPERIVNYKDLYETYRGTIIRKNFVVKPLDTTRILGGSSVTS